MRRDGVPTDLLGAAVVNACVLVATAGNTPRSAPNGASV